MDERHGATTANAKRYIDFAAANNIEAVMFEGWNEGWESWGGMQTFDYTNLMPISIMAEVARYAKEKGIEIIGHHETGGNIFNYERQLDNAYKWYADLGVHSVKTGYAGGLPGGHSIMDSSMYAITARWCRLPPVIIQPLMSTNLSKIQEFVVLTPI